MRKISDLWSLHEKKSEMPRLLWTNIKKTRRDYSHLYSHYRPGASKSLLNFQKLLSSLLHQALTRPTTLPFTVLYCRTLICNSYSVVLKTVNTILPFWLVHYRNFKFGKILQCNSVSGKHCSYSVVPRTVFKMHCWTFYTVWVLHCRTKARKKRRWGVLYCRIF